MKIENSFIGGCLYAIAYILLGCLIWALGDVIHGIFRLLSFEKTPGEFLAYALNGFSSTFEFFDFHWFLIKVITFNLVLFYLAVLTCNQKPARCDLARIQLCIDYYLKKAE